jgi:hypothetical protein
MQSLKSDVVLNKQWMNVRVRLIAAPRPPSIVGTPRPKTDYVRPTFITYRIILKY